MKWSDSLRRLQSRYVGSRTDRLGRAYWSTRASILERRFIRVTYDGEDWIHSWSSGALFRSLPTAAPVHETTVNQPLFFCRGGPQPGDIAMDIGAGYGTELCALAERVGPNGLVIGIEADADAYRQAQKLVHELGLRNVQLINAAVGSAPGYASLTSSTPGDQATFVEHFFEGEPPPGLPNVVQVSTLDLLLEDLGNPNVSWVKMNIEGSEYEALLGANRLLKSHSSWVISCHDFLGPGTETLQRVSRLLKSNGYETQQGCPGIRNPWADHYVFASHNPKIQRD